MRQEERGRARPSHKEPSLRRKYCEFCISNPFARAKQPAETSFSKEAPLTFKWLLPAKQCRNFLSVFHISSAIPPPSFPPPTFPRTALSSLRAHCPEKSRSFPFVPPPRHGISVSSRNLLILDESCCSRAAPLTNWKLVFSARLLPFNDCLRRDHSFNSVGNVYFSSCPCKIHGVFERGGKISFDSSFND